MKKLHIFVFVLSLFSGHCLAENQEIPDTSSYYGTNQIIVDFQLREEVRQIKFLKSCVRKEFQDGVRPYNSFYSADYLSDEGWGVRIYIHSGTLKTDLSKCVEKGAEALIFNWSYGAKASPNARQITDTGKSKFLDNINDPTLLETVNKRITVIAPEKPKNPNVINVIRRNHSRSMYDQKQIEAFKVLEKKNTRIFDITKVTIEYHPVQENNSLGQHKELDLLKDNLPNNKRLISYQARALSEEDWGKNPELREALKKIKEPMVLNPSEKSVFKPLYRQSDSLAIVFPEKRALWGLQHRYLFKQIYPTLTDEKYWNIRQILAMPEQYVVKKLPSLHRPRPPKSINGIKPSTEARIQFGKALRNFEENISNFMPATIARGNFSIIKAGNKIIDISKYPELIDIKYGYVWLFDPVTNLLIRFENTQFHLR